MKRALITVFLFGVAIFGTSTMVSAHPGHGGGLGHSHGQVHTHGHSHNHGRVIIYRSNFVSPYYNNNFYYQQPRIIHSGHLHGHHDHGHNHGGLRVRTGGFQFGLRY